MGRQLAWDHEGQYIAQDVARGLYFLHNIDVRTFIVYIYDHSSYRKTGTNHTGSADQITCAQSSSGAIINCCLLSSSLGRMCLADTWHSTHCVCTCRSCTGT